MTGSGRRDGDLPDDAGGDRRPVVVDDRDLVAGHGAAHRSGPDRHDPVAVGDDEVALGLAVELVDRRPQDVPAPVQELRAEGLAAAGHGPQAQVRAGPGAGAADHLERGRRQEDVPDGVPCHQVQRALRVELPGAVGEDGQAPVPGREQDVVQAADPGPVGRRPEDVARLRWERLGEQDAGHVAEQEPMGVERALGRAGRARRVDDDRRVIRQRVNGRERGRRGAELRRRSRASRRPRRRRPR